MINKLANVTVYVNDQDEALDFWTHKCEFKLIKDVPMGPNARWIEVSPPDSQTVLVLFPKDAMPNSNEMKPSMVFETEDINHSYEHMKYNGVRFKSEPQEFNFGKFVTFYDESDNEFGLREQPKV